MTIQWWFAALHLVALGIGLGSVWARSRALREKLDGDGLARVLHADTWWGVSALLWISTGLFRLFGGIEKGTAYYMQNHLFLAKMGLLVVILVLEVWPMAGLIRWRMQVRRGERPDTTAAPVFARISALQAVLVVLMVIAATGMARGFGSRGG